MKSLVIPISLLVCATLTCSATNYYISATGSDGASGTTTGTPWQTITKVNATVFSAGDIISFNGGDSFGGKIITQNGTGNSLITYNSYGTGKATITNGDVLMDKNITLKTGCILNSKVSFTELAAPDPGLFSAINVLVSANQNETSQVNFAAQNRQDSRKTAEEIKAANSQAQNLSTVQVVLYSIATKQQYSYEVSIIKSRILAGLIKVSPELLTLYKLNFSIKPSGDTDVIERAQLIQTMMQSWPIYQNTPAAQAFLQDMTELLFPNNAPKYLMAFNQAQQQAQSAQAQQQQQMMAMLAQTAQGIIELSKHKDYFSDSGKLHALPVIEQTAQQFEQIGKQIGKQTKDAGNKQQTNQPK